MDTTYCSSWIRLAWNLSWNRCMHRIIVSCSHRLQSSEKVLRGSTCLEKVLEHSTVDTLHCSKTFTGRLILVGGHRHLFDMNYTVLSALDKHTQKNTAYVPTTGVTLHCGTHLSADPEQHRFWIKTACITKFGMPNSAIPSCICLHETVLSTTPWSPSIAFDWHILMKYLFADVEDGPNIPPQGRTYPEENYFRVDNPGVRR